MPSEICSVLERHLAPSSGKVFGLGQDTYLAKKCCEITSIIGLLPEKSRLCNLMRSTAYDIRGLHRVAVIFASAEQKREMRLVLFKLFTDKESFNGDRQYHSPTWNPRSLISSLELTLEKAKVIAGLALDASVRLRVRKCRAEASLDHPSTLKKTISRAPSKAEIFGKAAGVFTL